MPTNFPFGIDGKLAFSPPFVIYGKGLIKLPLSEIPRNMILYSV